MSLRIPKSFYCPFPPQVHHKQEKENCFPSINHRLVEHATYGTRIFRQVNSSFRLYQGHLEIYSMPLCNRYQEPRQVRFHDSYEEPRNHGTKIRRTNFSPILTASEANQCNKNLSTFNSFFLPVMSDRVQTSNEFDRKSKLCIQHDFIPQDSLNSKKVKLEPSLQNLIKQNKNNKKRGNRTDDFSGSAKRNKYNIGQWTEDEQKAFLLGLRRNGKKWTKIGKSLKTRSPIQIKSHGQKMLKKLASGKDIFAVLESNASDAIKARISEAESDAAKVLFSMNSIKIEPVSHKK